VWVAEIMAQQTRLGSMLPYYRRWMKRFPTVRKLAAADEQDVLTAWEGLGYYSRARNLHKGAQIVVEQYSGRLPANWDALLALPGIGAYTAGAIGSLAFGLDVPAVDGNAIRVLARLFDVKDPMDTAAGKARFWQLAAQHLPAGWAAEYNQALMDLGAQVCTPKRPRCEACPLAAECQARPKGNQAQRPVKSKAAATPLRHFAAAVIRRRRRVLVLQRPARGLLASMWEFPNTRLTAVRTAKASLRRSLREELALDVALGAQFRTYEHTYSHFEARLQVYGAELNAPATKIDTDRNYAWLTPKALANLPMGRLDRRVAEDLLE
jgi:A/G-specific adenine glycosylase